MKNSEKLEISSLVIFLTQIVAKVALFALSNIISIYWLLIRIARALLSFTIFLLKKIVDIFPMLIAGIYYLILWIRFLCLGIISCFAERWTKICLAWRLIGEWEIARWYKYSFHTKEINWGKNTLGKSFSKKQFQQTYSRGYSFIIWSWIRMVEKSHY